MKPGTRIETKLIPVGEPEPRIEGAVAMPEFQSTLYETVHVVGVGGEDLIEDLERVLRS